MWVGIRPGRGANVRMRTLKNQTGIDVDGSTDWWDKVGNGQLVRKLQPSPAE